METAFNIQFQDITALSERASLLIEQEEWASNTGIVTKAAFFTQMYTLLSGAINAVNPVNCGFNADGSITSMIHVYPSISSLAYSLKTTYGTLSDRSISIHQETEVINFSVSNSAILKYVPENVPEYHWVGFVRNNKGVVIVPPTVTIEDGKILLSEKVYGSLSVRYLVHRHSYSLTVQARDSYGEGAGDLFGSVVYANYTGGVSWIEINNPPNVDKISTGDVPCGGNITVGDVPPHITDGPPPKYADGVEIKITYDYCSQLAKSSTKTYV